MRDMREWVWLWVGAGLAGTAVALGAFGAHGLEEMLEERGSVGTWETAVRYQMWHALALILAVVVAERSGRSMRLVGWAFTLGTLCFSGSLYALAQSSRWSAILGPITPLGGLLLLAGWVLFAFRLADARSRDEDAPQS